MVRDSWQLAGPSSTAKIEIAAPVELDNILLDKISEHYFFVAFESWYVLYSARSFVTVMIWACCISSREGRFQRPFFSGTSFYWLFRRQAGSFGSHGSFLHR